MKRKTPLMVGAAVLAAAALTGCGGNDHGSASMPPPPPQSDVTKLDSAQVLLLAQQTSETSTPFAVNDGLLVLTDTSDTAEAISVNGM